MCKHGAQQPFTHSLTHSLKVPSSASAATCERLSQIRCSVRELTICLFMLQISSAIIIGELPAHKRCHSFCILLGIHTTTERRPDQTTFRRIDKSCAFVDRMEQNVQQVQTRLDAVSSNSTAGVLLVCVGTRSCKRMWVVCCVTMCSLCAVYEYFAVSDIDSTTRVVCLFVCLHSDWVDLALCGG